VAGVAGERERMDPELGQGALPFVAEQRVEHDRLVGRHGEPAVRLDLGVELTRPPAGISQREEAPRRPLAAANGAQDVERRGQGEMVADDQGRGLLVVGGMEHEATAAFDRAAEMHVALQPKPRRLDPELAQELGQAQLLDELVNDNAERALLVVGAHEDDRALEARILHLRHCDKQLTGQRGHPNPPFGLDMGPGRAPYKRPSMLTRLLLPMALAALALAAPARAATAASDWFATDQGRVRLVAAEPFVGDQREVELGLQFDLKPGWKIYWRAPGDAGYPPHVDWAGSQNLSGAEIAWPAPMRFSVLGLQTMGYEGEVVLPVHATLAHAGAPAAFHAALSYLTCSEICVPYETTLALDLPAGPAAQPGQGFGALIARYAARVPGDGRSAGLALGGAVLRPGNPATLELAIATDRPLGAGADAFIENGGDASFGVPTARAAGPNETLLRLPVFGPRAASDALVGKSLTVTVVDGERAMSGRVAPQRGAPLVDLAVLLPMLLVALAGGLVLNVMPCVLPVLSLKLIGAIEHGNRPLRAVRAGFLGTATGILLSFAALALAMIGAQTAGLAVGWGMQFQSPFFLAAMAALLTLFAANLWGLYEIALPRMFARAAERMPIGNIATGAFATLLATPCSAPFLGTALGFALAAGPVEIIAIFMALGVGFAAPYLVVATVPGLARLLPRPGNWMVAVRRLLGFALGGTALWLVFVLAAETGARPAAATGALLMAMVLAFIALRGAVRAGAVAAFVALTLVAPFAARPPEATAATGLWSPFAPSKLGPLVHDGRVVFVDVTAQWCLTCKLNERLVLDNAAIRKQLAAPGVVAMRADWTRPDPAIADYLKRFGRYGIPFNAVYGPGAPAGLALPEILTTDEVRAALARAAVPADGRG